MGTDSDEGWMDGNERHDCPFTVPVPGQKEESEGFAVRRTVCRCKLAHQSACNGRADKVRNARLARTFTTRIASHKPLDTHGPESR